MDSKYSPDAVAAARSLQIFAYIYTLMATFWIYDYACSIREEGKFLLCSRWSKVKFLYVVTRYVPFLLLAALSYVNLVPDETLDTCQFVTNVHLALGTIALVGSECFFILRTYVLWNSNKVVLTVMLSTSAVSCMQYRSFAMRTKYQAMTVGSAVVGFSATATAPFETSSVTGSTGCYQSSDSGKLSVPFLLLVGFELMCYIMRVVCYTYRGMFQDFQIIIHVILATRMHLHLWHADRNRNADAFDAFALPRVILTTGVFAFRVVLNEGTIAIDYFSGVLSEIGSWSVGEIDPAVSFVLVRFAPSLALCPRAFAINSNRVFAESQGSRLARTAS
ncbi:hypothetical protein EDB19DRAFT_2025439 [Suillus lakei]|nr:hypothetical protein EDB19DRAFT_2025439 [Suillus lakei]